MSGIDLDDKTTALLALDLAITQVERTVKPSNAQELLPCPCCAQMTRPLDLLRYQRNRLSKIYSQVDPVLDDDN